MRDADEHLMAIGGELAPELAGPILVTARAAALRWGRPAIAIAADEGTPITAAQLDRAARSELEAMGKLPT